MFTGIIEGMGTVRTVTRRPEGKRLVIRLDIAAQLEPGASLAVDGVCLTVVEKTDKYASFDIVPETISKTTLGELAAGASVNFERSLQVGGRFDGHFVQGHVDTVTKVTKVDRHDGNHKIWFATPPEVASLIVAQGSIAINGVSLTIAEHTAKEFAVALIPTTLELTNLGSLKIGDSVNLEADMLAKHVANQLVHYQAR